MAHPRESEEWRGMTMRQRYEFFAPIWRVMRDDNMSADDVAEQVAYVALAVKQGSQVSDMRHHTFSGRLRGAQVVYFRANSAGACNYFNDSRYWRYSHGTTWAELCDDLTVVDVPGDHFSLLRQDAPDMEPMVAMLKLKLGAFGWAEAVRRERRAARSVASGGGAAGAGGAGGGGGGGGGGEMAAELSDYLGRMGVDADIRQRLASALPVADLQQLALASGGGAPLRPGTLVRPLSRPSPPLGVSTPESRASATSAGAQAARIGSDPGLLPLIVVPGADATLPDLAEALGQLPRSCYALDLPPRRHLARLRTVPALAAVLVQALREAAPPGPWVVAGVGLGGAVAHELAVQLQRAGERVPVLLLVEDGGLRAAADMSDQPYFRLYHLLQAWRPDLDLAAFCHEARMLGAQPAGYERQLDAVLALMPAGMDRADWEELVGDRLQRTARGGHQWEEVLSSWAALHAFALRCLRTHNAAAAAAAASAAPPPGAPSDAGAADDVTADVIGGPMVPLPPLEGVLLDLFALEGDPEAQLDYLAQYRPPSVTPGDWDRGVSQVVTHVAYLRAITRAHAPDGLLPHTAHAVLHGASHRSVRDLVVDGGAAGALRPVAPLLVPLHMVGACGRRPARCVLRTDNVLMSLYSGP
ncbi:type I polyketide synthase [Monoraphidium neglectum]|uniref:Type I polyketide synthase n=1 Tax=Monoraphidium neglectum TaxID=145388 RepID=A0A0D2KEP8_9CHLO|nr:type I polyketide synthase [Monoraphidium neglectum]KIY94328.1 type I polyketide synthase [Monoraphidium neglectum]|eukprot:XP_013893348.1 type I polyketide synthase [Monoraphidium neglectum]